MHLDCQPDELGLLESSVITRSVQEEAIDETTRLDQTVRQIDVSTENEFGFSNQNTDSSHNYIQFESSLKRIVEKLTNYLQISFDKVFADTMLANLKPVSDKTAPVEL